MKVLKLLLLTPFFILIFIAVAVMAIILLPVIVFVVFAVLVALLAGVDFNIDVSKPKKPKKRGVRMNNKGEVVSTTHTGDTK